FARRSLPAPARRATGGSRHEPSRDSRGPRPEAAARERGPQPRRPGRGGLQAFARLRASAPLGGRKVWEVRELSAVWPAWSVAVRPLPPRSVHRDGAPRLRRGKRPTGLTIANGGRWVLRTGPGASGRDAPEAPWRG